MADLSVQEWLTAVAASDDNLNVRRVAARAGAMLVAAYDVVGAARQWADNREQDARLARRSVIPSAQRLLDALAQLDSIVDENPETPHRADRGSDVAAWIKAARDRQDKTGGSHDLARWHVLDDLLDDYRLHADTGTPLLEHACEGINCCADLLDGA